MLIEESKVVELLTSIRSELLSSRNFWLIKTEGKVLLDVFLPIDSQVFIFSVKESRIVVDEVYNLDHGLE